MSEKIIKIAEDFWNIRGEFKLGGLLDIGTHASLVRCSDGRYVLLDSYTLKKKLRRQVDELTDGGAKLKAILNLHPFHTVHVESMHLQYPDARLYGTERHLEKFPGLPWEPELTNSAAFAALFSADLEFSVPAGVEFIPRNQQLHFASVLAYHPASRTIHSDDTLMYVRLPGKLGKAARKLKKPTIAFHPTLRMTLKREPGAARQFRDWAEKLALDWADAEYLCAAHAAIYSADDKPGGRVAAKIRRALEKVEGTLRRHEQRFG